MIRLQSSLGAPAPEFRVAIVSVVVAVAAAAAFVPAALFLLPAREAMARPRHLAATRLSPPRGRVGARVPPGAQSLEKGSLGISSPSRIGLARGGDLRSKDSLGDEIPAPLEGEHDRDRIVRLQDALRDILKNRVLARTRVGMRVASVLNGRLFYARRADALMDPASNQKLLATTAALMRLGTDWTYRTELSGAQPDGDGVIPGNLYIRGNGDPSLRAAKLSSWAADLRNRGITEIAGGVMADARRLGSEVALADGGSDGAEDSTARAPLVVDRGVTLVRVHPGPTVGAPALVLTNPPAPLEEKAHSGFTIVNHAVTKEGGKTRVAVKVGVSAGSLRIDVSGRIALGTAGVAFRRRVPHPALHTAVMLRAALLAEGIVVREGAGTANPSDAPGFVAVHRSDPLGTLLRRINKDSDNDQAERVLQTVGAEMRGGAPSTEKGLAVLREVLDGMGVRASDYVPRNGSGLGHANRITPGAMTALLRALYFDPRVGPDILQSLSVGGVDGTTRNRFKGTLAARRVRSKTGTLNGKSCLSGLVGDGNDIVVFSMMMQGFRGGSLHAVRASQVGAVNAMMRYVREGAGERVSWPTALDENTVGKDVETGGEVHESGQEGEEENDDGVMEPTLDLGDGNPPKSRPAKP